MLLQKKWQEFWTTDKQKCLLVSHRLVTLKTLEECRWYLSWTETNSCYAMAMAVCFALWCLVFCIVVLYGKNHQSCKTCIVL